MGNEKFNVGLVKTRMTEIEGLFDDFGATLSEVNILVESLVQNGDYSAIQGFVGTDLFSIWDNNASTFDTFKKNFQNWTEVVQIISANNAQFVVEAAATYRDTGKSLDGVEAARQTYSNGDISFNDLKESSSFNGYASEPKKDDNDPTIIEDKTDDASLNDKPTDNDYSASTTSKTITRGDVVSLGNGNYNYYGTTKGGKNIYTDSNQDLYYEDENGNAVNITRSQYMGGTNTQTVNFNVKDIGSSSDVHGYSNPIVLSVDGEYVGYGATTGSNINTSIVYENSDVAPNVVSSVQGDTTGTTYRVGATNMNVSESSDNIVIPRQESEFISAVQNGQDIKLTPDATLKYDPSGLWNTETLTNGGNNVYLRYDQGTQKYYIADENGTYSTSSTGYSPDVLTNGDSSLKFN